MKIDLDDEEQSQKYLEGLQPARPFYEDKTLDDLPELLKGKTDVVPYMYEGDGWSTGITFCYHQNYGMHFILNSWVQGDVDLETAMAKQIEYGREYIAEYNVTKIGCKQHKDITGDSTLLLGNPAFDILKRNFRDVKVFRETDEYLFYIIEI